MTIALEVLARIRGTLSVATDPGTASVPISETALVEFANGTGANQANAVYVDEFSIASADNTTYDLAGSLEDALGQACVFTAIKAIYVEAAGANTTNLTIGNGTNPFVGPFDDGTATVTLKPGACLLVTDPSAAGWTVGAGTADVIKIANGSGATATGRIVLIGEA